MHILKGIFLILLTVLFFDVAGQSKLLNKANLLYNADRYAEAIPFFEKYLKEKSNLSTQSKLAYCYYINNNLEKAEVLYASITKKERAKAIAFFYYGEVLMAKGNYKEAGKWFQDYQKLEPEDERGAQKIHACRFIQNIKPYFEFVRIENFMQNSDADDLSPVFWKDGIVFASDCKQGIKPLKQKSGWTGREYLRLYYSSFLPDSSAYKKPKSFSARFNELNKNTANASFSADGQEAFFSRNGTTLSRHNAYNMQLFQVKTGKRRRWKRPKRLPFSNPEHNYMHPTISKDGRWLFFVSDKPRGEGGTDIYVVEKKKNGWGKVKSLGEEINTSFHEGFPYFHTDGRLFFCSKGHSGYGGFDIFVTTQDPSGQWTAPINIGTPINSPKDDMSLFMSADETKGLFTSSREGGDDDIYLFWMDGQKQGTDNK